MSSSPNKYNVFCNVTFPRIALDFSHTAHVSDLNTHKDATIKSSEQIGFTSIDVSGNVHFELSYEDQIIGTDVLRMLYVLPDIFEKIYTPFVDRECTAERQHKY
nr:unnamed protein product [Spirometra erinaceieuropaei]